MTEESETRSTFVLVDNRIAQHADNELHQGHCTRCHRYLIPKIYSLSDWIALLMETVLRTAQESRSLCKRRTGSAKEKYTQRRTKVREVR